MHFPVESSKCFRFAFIFALCSCLFAITVAALMCAVELVT